MVVKSSNISLSLFVCLVLLSITLYNYFPFHVWKPYLSSHERAEKFTKKKLNSTNYIVFSNDRYSCPGFRHLRENLACQIAIAEHLNRTMIFPERICILKQHATSFFYPTPTKSRSILTETVININVLSKYLNIVSKDSATVNQNNSITYLFDSLPIVKKYSYRFWYELCPNIYSRNPSEYVISDIEKIFHYYLQPQYLLDLAHQIMNIIQKPSYTAVHIRRGDKLFEGRYKKFLDNCTRPNWIRGKLNSLDISNGAVYIATNEYNPNFFRALNQWYTVYTIMNFSTLLNQTIRQNEYALLIIDEIVYSNAKVKVSTFVEPYTNISLCPTSRVGN